MSDQQPPSIIVFYASTVRRMLQRDIIAATAYADLCVQYLTEAGLHEDAEILRSAIDGTGRNAVIQEMQPMTDHQPSIGSLWGVPGKPETRRFVTFVTVEFVTFTEIGGAANCLPINDWFALVAEDGLIALTSALQPKPAPAGETVRVRACVGRDDHGKLYVYGGDPLTESDADMAATVRSADYEPFAFIEATVPARTYPVIEAAAVPAEGGDQP